jgi:hypothetical protein
VRTICLALTPVGAVVAGVLTTALGGDPRPVFLGAGLLIMITTVIAWTTALRHLHQR